MEWWKRRDSELRMLPTPGWSTERLQKTWWTGVLLMRNRRTKMMRRQRESELQKLPALQV